MGVPCWMLTVLCSSLTLTTFGREDKALLRSILVGGVWNGFLLQKVKGQRVPCSSVGVQTVMVTFLESVLFHL